MKIRDATKQDAAELAVLIDLAGEGIPGYLWSQMAGPGQTPMEVGRERAARETGAFSYTNARVCSEAGQVLGMIVAYLQPDPYECTNLAEYPDFIRPLVLLEARAPGSWYVNAIATHPEQRGRGVARTLLADTEQRARARGCTELSLIVASANTAAYRLYERLGYAMRASLPVVQFPGCQHGGDWILMTRMIG